MKTMTKRLLAFVLTFATVFTTAFADMSFTSKATESGETNATTYVSSASDYQWQEVALSDITAEDTVAITMTTADGTTYVLPNAEATSGNATAVTGTITNGVLTVSTGSDSDYGWNITTNTNDVTNEDGSTTTETSYVIKSGDNYLSTIGSANSTRVNTTETVWKLNSENYFSTNVVKKEVDTTVVLGVYTSKPDWRCYANPSYVANQTLKFFKQVSLPKQGSEISVSDLTDGTEFVLSVGGSVVTSTLDSNGCVVVDSDKTTVNDSVLSVADQATLDSLLVLTVHSTDDGLTFTNADGAFLTSGSTGNKVTFETEANEYSYWNIEQRQDGINVIVNTKASFTNTKKNTSYNQALEKYQPKNSDKVQVYTYNYLSSYTDVANYEAHFYSVPAIATTSDDSSTDTKDDSSSESSETEETPSDETTPAIADGTYVIYNPSSKMAMSTEDLASDKVYYRKAVSMELNASGSFDSIDDTLKWTVKNNADGTVTISTASGKVLSSGEGTAKNLSLDTNKNNWTLESADNGLFYVKDATKSTYIEYFSKYTEFSTYSFNEDSKAIYAMQFVACDAASSSSTTDETVTTGVTDGTYVIYNPSSKMAMSSTAISTNYRAGVEMTLNASGSFDSVADTEKWTVKNNADGTVTISCAEGTLSVSDKYSSANFATDNEHKTWTLVSAGDGTFYVKNATKAEGTYGPYWLEWYSSKTEFTTYSTSEAKLGDAYKMQFVACDAASSSSTTDETVTTGVTDGTYVIYNPSSKMAMSSTAISTNYRAGVEMTLNASGSFDSVADTEKWTVKNNADGTVTISCAEGTLSVSDKYSSANFATDNENKTWTLVSAGDGTFYVKNATKAEGTYGPYWLEWYSDKTEFTTYSTSESKLGDAYKMQFVATTAASESKEEETVDTQLISDGNYYIYSASAAGVLKYGITAGCAANVAATYNLSTNSVEETDALKGAAVFAVKYDSSKKAYTFTCGGKYLAANSAEELYLADSASNTSSAGTYWAIEQVKDADGNSLGYTFKSTSVKYNSYDVYMEYYSSKGFCLYTAKSLSEIYYFQFPVAADGCDEDGDGYAYAECPKAAALPEAGSTVVISNDANKQVIGSMIKGDEGSESSMGAVDIDFAEDGTYSVSNGGLIFTVGIDDSLDFSSAAALTVSEDADGNFVFTNDGKYLTASADGKSLSFADSASDYSSWKLEANDDGFYVINTKAVYTYNTTNYDAAIEYYNGYFTAYEINKSNSKYSGDKYTMSFYDADGNQLSEVKSGETVYMYNSSSKYALASKANSKGTSIAGTSVGSKYYYFKNQGQYLATNNDEELLVQDELDDFAKWEIVPVVGGYLLKSKSAAWTSSSGNSYPIYVEYFSGAFAGYSYKATSSDIFTFNLYQVEDTYNTGYVINPSVEFKTDSNANWGVSYTMNFTLEDLGTIKSCKAEVTFEDGTTKDYDTTLKNYDGSVVIPGDDITNHSSMTVKILATSQETDTVSVDFDGSKTVAIDDLPVITAVTPEANGQTGDNKKPSVIVNFANAKDNATYEMTVNGEAVEVTVNDSLKTFTYTPSSDLEDGKYTVVATITREDGKVATKTWSFNVGKVGVQLYFGQLHSHTAEYSDGSGTLEQAYQYAMYSAADCDYMIVTDHSNYFDTTTTANASDYSAKDAIENADYKAISDSTTTDADGNTLNKWEEAKATASDYNALSSDFVAAYGYEMTWSGGPGHINTFNTAGIVSRNNNSLNSKTNDAGMFEFYDLLVQAQADGATSTSSSAIVAQFNHPGTTFGYFDSFTGWSEERDDVMNLIEVGNGDGAIGGTAYFPSYEYYDMCLTTGWHVAPTNGQDNHKGSWGDSNTARTVILTDDFTEAGLYDAMDARHLYSTEDQNLSMYYYVNDDYLMGDIIKDYTGDSVKISLSLSDADREDLGYAYIIGLDGKVLYTSDYLNGNTADLTFTLDNSSPYYYVKVVEKDGDIAVSAPVWTADVASKSNVTATVTYAGETDGTKLVENNKTTLTATLTNGDSTDLKVTSYTVTVDGETVDTNTLENAVTVKAGETYNVEKEYTFTSYGTKQVKVSFTYTVGTDSFTKTASNNIRVNGADYDTVSEIKTVKAGSEGQEFTIEGYVTANTSGYDKNTAFFDCTYVQDSTGGINVFPVSDSLQVGQKVRAHGAITYYNGEIELNLSEQYGGYIEVIEDGITTVNPTKVTTANAMTEDNIGLLMQITGKVTRIHEAEGVVDRIYVRDNSGLDACVYINGYIWNSATQDYTFGTNGKTPAVGDKVTVIGIGSVDVDELGEVEYLHRLRVRDRAEITVKKASSSSSASDTIYSGSDSSSSTSTSTGTTTTTDTTTTYPVVTTPSTKTSTKTATATTETATEEETEEETIESPETPTVAEDSSEASVESNDKDDNANIGDDEVPTTGTEENSSSMIWLWILVAVAVILIVGYVVYSKKKKSLK